MMYTPPEWGLVNAVSCGLSALHFGGRLSIPFSPLHVMPRYSSSIQEEWNSEYSRSSVSSEGDEEEEADDSHDEGSDIDGIAAQGHGVMEGSSREGCAAAPHGALGGDSAEQDAEGDVPR